MKAKCVYCSKQFSDETFMAQHVATVHPEHVPTEQEINDLALQSIAAFLRSDGRDPGLLAKAKQANGYRSTEAKKEQTQSAREATLVMMARELAENKTEFRKFMRLAIPTAPLIKGLPASETA